ncbi:MAG TPA: hypothetical protein IGS17_16355 [Oscillatoriales cyanobacterium M59_W2019_021]|nr:MAG: hypothetical protein D6728_18295 [Cyanobacteria bacterium J055]HIK32738.1 hypothetical protein [Oscillatoriales cyanobacterium M4454_W2019_049]HIK52477.1 hypothetical protein [Oscillatoriales cyanobacterium M59_W2019_021]
MHRRDYEETVDTVVRPVYEVKPVRDEDGFDTPWQIITGFIGSMMPIGANIPWLGIRGRWRFCPLRPVKSAVVYCGVPAAFMFFGGCMASRVNQNPLPTGNPFTDAGYTAGVNWINPSVDAGLQTTGTTVQVLWNQGGDAYKASLVELDRSMQGRYTPVSAGQPAARPQVSGNRRPAAVVPPAPVPGATTVNFSTVGEK